MHIDVGNFYSFFGIEIVGPATTDVRILGIGVSVLNGALNGFEPGTRLLPGYGRELVRSVYQVATS